MLLQPSPLKIDSPRLVADASLARKELTWQPRFDCLEKIIAHAWVGESKPVTIPSLAEGTA